MLRILLPRPEVANIFDFLQFQKLISITEFQVNLTQLFLSRKSNNLLNFFSILWKKYYIGFLIFSGQ